MIDFIMLVTINLRPFDGKISMDHYLMNPCKFTDLYKQQLFGNYNDTFEDFSHEMFQTFFTTCINAKKGEFPSVYMENCTNIVSLVSRIYRCRISFMLSIAINESLRKPEICIESMQILILVSTTFQNGWFIKQNFLNSLGKL